jgi:DNA-binding HxlR family transcriptional regulator
MEGTRYAGQDCSLARALEVIGERWTLLIIRDAFYGVRHFNDFRAHLDIPKAVLADRLAGLVDDGILDRRTDPGHAGRHLYELTQAGRDLWPAMHALLTWGAQHRAPNRLLFKHARCLTELDHRGHCQTCQLIPPPVEVLADPAPGRGSRRQDPVTLALRDPHPLLQPLDTTRRPGRASRVSTDRHQEGLCRT